MRAARGRVEQNANGLVWGLDNRICLANTTSIYGSRTASSKCAGPYRGEWGATYDDAGRVYRNTNESALHVDFVPTAYFARNPMLLRTRGSYESIGDANVNVAWSVRPNPGTNRAYQFGIDKEDGSIARFTSVCAPMVYRGDRLPADVYGNVFVAEGRFYQPPDREDDARLTASKAPTRANSWRRPTSVSGPSICQRTRWDPVIVDIRGIIQQRADITEYLHNHIVTRKLDRIGLGRIYRVMHDTTKRDVKPALSRMSWRSWSRPVAPERLVA